MAQDLNHMSHGNTSLKDTDLMDMDLKLCRRLPWLRSILEELQYLRLERSPPLDRVRYLERVLDEVGAKYDESYVRHAEV